MMLLSGVKRLNVVQLFQPEHQVTFQHRRVFGVAVAFAGHDDHTADVCLQAVAYKARHFPPGFFYGAAVQIQSGFRVVFTQAQFAVHAVLNAGAFKTDDIVRADSGYFTAAQTIGIRGWLIFQCRPAAFGAVITRPYVFHQGFTLGDVDLSDPGHLA